MAQWKEDDKLEDLAKRIEHAEQEAGLKPAPPNPEEVTNRITRKGYRVGTDFLVAILTFVAMGWLVDHVFGTKPWGLLILMAVGFIVATMNLWRAVNRTNGNTPNNNA